MDDLDATLEPGQELTWDVLVYTCSRTAHPEDDYRVPFMLDVDVLPFRSLRVTPAVVVPTRMHEPGFYLRSPSWTPRWAVWLAREEDFLLGELKRLVDAGRVRVR